MSKTSKDRNSAHLSVFNHVLDALIEQKAITPAKASSMAEPASQATIIDRLVDEEIQPDQIADAISKSLKLKLFPSGATPYIRATDWVLMDDVLYLVNPLGPRAKELKERYVDKTEVADTKNGLHFKEWGVISTNDIDSVAVSAAKLDSSVSEKADTTEEPDIVGEKLLLNIMHKAIESGVSDVHIDPHPSDARIKMRIDGRLKTIDTITMGDDYRSLANTLLTKSRNEPGSYNSPQDGQFKWPLKHREISVRLNMLPTKVASSIFPKFTLRLLGLDNTLADLDKLNFSDEHKDVFKSIIHRPNGLILVTGPTGSGKTTTLYALLRHLYQISPDKAFFTAEDPVEIPVAGFNQTEINDAANMGFGDALKALLRSDPDVILVGEIRDTVTAELALKASLTGHIVFSTLHTNSAIDTVARLLNMDLDRVLLADALTAVTAQRMVSKVCQHCSERISFGDKEEYEHLYGDLRHAPKADMPIRVANPAGCDEPGCEKGYSGRAVVNEIIVFDREFSDMVATGASKSEMLNYLATHANYEDMWGDGMRLVKEGITTIEELFNKLGPREKLIIQSEDK